MRAQISRDPRFGRYRTHFLPSVLSSMQSKSYFNIHICMSNLLYIYRHIYSRSGGSGFISAKRSDPRFLRPFTASCLISHEKVCHHSFSCWHFGAIRPFCLFLHPRCSLRSFPLKTFRALAASPASARRALINS